MPEEVAGEKTIPASALKRRRAREKGNVAKSLDLTAGLSLLAALVALRFLGPGMFANLAAMTEYYFSDACALRPELHTPQSLAAGVLLVTGSCVLPFMLVMLVAGIAVNVAQVGFLLSPQAMAPKLERLNVFTGIQRFFSPRSFVELVKSILKLTKLE